jgi:bacillithiol system protein YtxJ
MNQTEPVRIREPTELDAALAQPVAVIYKHSPRCGVSSAAVGEVRRFMAACPGVPVYLVDVVRDRALARDVSVRLGVRHESPQAIVVRQGRAGWYASHAAVRASALRSATAEGEGEGEGEGPA